MSHASKHFVAPRWRVVEYHGSLRGRVLWMDELYLERPYGRTYHRRVTALPHLDKIKVNLSVTP